jgi:hypothetical protein
MLMILSMEMSVRIYIMFVKYYTDGSLSAKTMMALSLPVQ